MSVSNDPPFAYAIIAGKEIIDDASIEGRRNSFPAIAGNVVDMSVVELDDGLVLRNHRASERYRHIPQVRNLTWEDDYFEDNTNHHHNEEDDVIAAFDLDYDQMEIYYGQIGWWSYGATCLFPSCFWTATFLGAPCFLNQNVQWAVRAQHVAVTTRGVRMVKEQRPTCWGSSCTDAGKWSKVIPFDKITDCVIQEPAGNTCFCVVNTLYTVTIHTTTDERRHPNDITIVGLKNPKAFQELVLAMKLYTTVPASLNMMSNEHRGDMVVGDTNNDDDVASLLRDIRDELRQHNQALQSLNLLSPSAPPDSIV